MVVITPTDMWGYAGGFFLFVVLTPQVWKTYKTRNADGLSPFFLLFEFLASVCFIVYGFLLPQGAGVPIVVSNCSALLCTMLLVIAKLIFDRKTTSDDVSSTSPDYTALESGQAPWFIIVAAVLCTGFCKIIPRRVALPLWVCVGYISKQSKKKNNTCCYIYILWKYSFVDCFFYF